MFPVGTQIPKSIFFVLFLALFCAIILGGCSGGDSGSGTGSNSESDTKNGFSEYDFTSDPNVRVTPGNIAAIFLEPSDAVDTITPDTNGLGADYIPVRIMERNQYTYSLDTRDNTIKSASLINSGGGEVFTLNADKPTITLYLSPGDFDFIITSGFTRADSGDSDHRVAFLCPDMGFRNPGETRTAQDAFKQILRVNSAPRGNLRGINLSYACLAGSDLYSCSLEDANLNSADLESAEVSTATLDGACFQASNMEGINLSDSSLRKADFHAANLTNANLISADLSEANLFSAQMEGINMMAACLDNAYIYAADLSYGNLEGATLREANLGAAYLHRASLHNANLTSSNLADADFTYSVLKNAILSGANIEGTDFTGADTTGVVW